MAWAIIDSRNPSKRQLDPTEARVRKSGEIVISKEAAAEAGLNGYAIVLLDKEGERIGLRAPSPEEQHMALKLRPAAKSPKGKQLSKELEIHCSVAFRRAGWPLGKTCRHAGLRAVYIRKDEPPLLIVKLGEGGGEEE